LALISVLFVKQIRPVEGVVLVSSPNDISLEKLDIFILANFIREKKVELFFFPYVTISSNVAY
jgi:hypothetical protein